MKTLSLPRLTLLSALIFSPLTLAADNLSVEINIPRLNVAEYHKPYIAVWLEDELRKATQLALWYDVDKRDNEGKKWLKDMRQWWRRVGRANQAPYDGLTSATKGPGQHHLTFALNDDQLAKLAPGKYQLRIEASREVGGRELLTIPVTWPITASELPLTVSGKNELGNVILKVN